MAKDHYTTTEAAELLAVSPDTVLKWVKAGKIRSYRTPGGHARIPRDAVATLLSEKEGVQGRNGAFNGVTHRYCWDFYADGGAVKEECRSCIAYKSRAHRCYEMRDLPGKFGPLKMHCELNCTECEYYKLMQGQATNTLVITQNRNLMDTLQRGEERSNLSIQFASCEYDCAAVIEKFRPDYVVVDCTIGVARTREMCQHLMNDPRIPFVRIILCSRTTKERNFCDDEVFGWIRRPFTLGQLEELVLGAGER